MVVLLLILLAKFQALEVEVVPQEIHRIIITAEITDVQILAEEVVPAVMLGDVIVVLELEEEGLVLY